MWPEGAKKFLGLNIKCRISPIVRKKKVGFAQFLREKCRIWWPEGAKKFLGVNFSCTKDLAVGKEIRTSRKITKWQYKHITPAYAMQYNIISLHAELSQMQ